MNHTLKPIFNKRSRTLILGSFPSVKSRESKFYYGHPQNRFWPLLAKIYETTKPNTNEEKKEFLLKHNIALWDVISSCDINGSSDSSITNVVPNDVTIILNNTNIKQIYTNGNKAHTLYQKFIYPVIKIQDTPLPSTSPANATYSLDKLYDKWHIIKTIPIK